MRIFSFALCAVFALSTAAAADPVVTIKSRGQKITTVFLKHHGTAKGSVILLAGDNGRLDIVNGTITKLAGNQLVRTRTNYAAKGYDTMVPDLAFDMKDGSNGVVSGYRVSQDYADDIGAMVTYLRKHGAKPVVVIGTSRGSGGAANAVAKLTGAKRPDGAVYTSAFLKLDCSEIINFWCLTNHQPALLTLPSLVVWHVDDTCAATLPSAVPPFKTWWQKGTHLKLAQKSFKGGDPPQPDVCGAESPHGFWGLDTQVVSAIVKWIASLPAPADER